MVTTEHHYKITFQDGSTYYGRTKHHLYERWGQHLADARKGVHRNKHICEIYNKYGYDDWTYELLSTETGDAQHQFGIEFSYIQADPKAINIQSGIFSQNKKEWSARHARRRRAERTPEEREKFLREQRETYKIKRASITPQELEKIRRMGRESYHRQRAKWTDENTEEYRRKDRERKAKKHSKIENREEYNRYMREYMRKRRNKEVDKVV